MKSNVINNIILIGFMGSGKSRVGSEIAKILNKKFIDVDSVIEERENMKIVDIFQAKGQEYFRQLERDFANEIINSIDNSVIAVGGGFPTVVKNIKDMGKIVYLDIDFDFMITELSKVKGEIEKRPLLNNIDFARNLYISRKDLYESIADLKIEVQSRNIDEVISKILNGLNA